MKIITQTALLSGRKWKMVKKVATAIFAAQAEMQQRERGYCVVKRDLDGLNAPK